MDHYRSKLTAGGHEQPCGWLKDKFGGSWQVVSTLLGQLLGDKGRQAMMTMKKIDMKALQAVYDGH